jgi:hypothetical protein
MNSWELGDSDSERSRIDIGCGRREVVSFRRWGIGLRYKDGIESERVGVKMLGGSYLQNERQFEIRPMLWYKSPRSSPDTHNKHFESLDRYGIVSKNIGKP